jgi:D-glycero-D-manno-heptose 1,7-bisphosphate phosphatase
VFLDRDGVLNVRPPDHEYLTSAERFAWLPGAQAAIAELKGAGWKVAVVSNQRGVARGLVSSGTLAEIEARIQADLGPAAALDGFFYCPHDLDAGCDCRKPRPGLIVRAAAELGVEPEGSWMIGDDESDIAAGRAAGCSTILISPEASDTAADLVEPDLATAARRLC